MAGTVQCNVCKNEFSEDSVIKMGDYAVCANCKPVFLQRLREGMPLVAGDRVYGGFWIRFVAKLIDGIVTGAIGYAVGLVMGLVMGRAGTIGSGLLNLVIYFAYPTFLVGTYGATLGKMAVGLKVVRSDGSQVTYGRAFGRVWGEMLSSITFSVGYIMAGFDSEKRALHDRICDTRVVKAN